MTAKRLWVHEQPAPPGAPVVVLVHGSMDRSTSFAKVARRLAGWTVVRYDRRGYGRSLELGAATGVAQQVDDLLGVLGDRRGVLAGHSFGGVVACAAAVAAPHRVAAVLAYEAPMAWRDWWPRDTAGGSAIAAGADDAASAGDAAERFMRRIVGDAVWERLPPSTRAHRRAEGAALVAELRSLRPPNPPPYEPAALTLPVLAAHGTRSAPHHRDAARQLADEAPHGQLHVVEGAGHGIHTGDPAAFAHLVRAAVAAGASAAR